MSWVLVKKSRNNKLYFEQVSGNQVHLSDNILRAKKYDDEDSAEKVKEYLERTFDVNFCGVEPFEFNFGSNLTENQKILILRLRKDTGGGMLGCKYALTNTDWDYSAAKNYLRDRVNLISCLDQNKNW